MKRFYLQRYFIFIFYVVIDIFSFPRNSIAINNNILKINNESTICVKRLENTGILNLIPVTIIISENIGMTLLGGEARCVHVSRRRHYIGLKFAYPAAIKNPKYWYTRPVHFRLKSGEIASFELRENQQDHNNPNWPRSGWHDMWMLRRVGVKSGQQCTGP